MDLAHVKPVKIKAIAPRKSSVAMLSSSRNRLELNIRGSSSEHPIRLDDDVVLSGCTADGQREHSAFCLPADRHALRFTDPSADTNLVGAADLQVSRLIAGPFSVARSREAGCFYALAYGGGQRRSGGT